jgi:hypothetical protein
MQKSTITSFEIVKKGLIFPLILIFTAALPGTGSSNTLLEESKSPRAGSQLLVTAIPMDKLHYKHPLSTFNKSLAACHTGTPQPIWWSVAVQKGLEVLDPESLGILIAENAVNADSVVVQTRWELNVESGMIYRSVKSDRPSEHDSVVQLGPEVTGEERERYKTLVAEMKRIVDTIAEGGDLGLHIYPAIPELNETSEYLGAVMRDLQ